MFDADAYYEAYYRAEIDYRRDQIARARTPIRRRFWTRLAR